jgi:hypothetical protein
VQGDLRHRLHLHRGGPVGVDVRPLPIQLKGKELAQGDLHRVQEPFVKVDRP